MDDILIITVNTLFIVILNCNSGCLFKFWYGTINDFELNWIEFELNLQCYKAIT